MPFLTESLPSVVLTFLGARYAGQPFAAKHLARAADATPRAAENWLAGLACPSGDRLAALMATHPDLEQAIIDHVHRVRASTEAAAQASARARARAMGA